MNTPHIVLGLVAAYLLIGAVFATWVHGLKPDDRQLSMSWSEIALKWPPIAFVVLFGIAMVRGIENMDEVKN